MDTRPSYPIESVDRALTLLGLFKERHTLRLSDAAQALGVAKSTAHRLLAMLALHGFVEQEAATRRYHVGPGLVEIGLAVTGSIDVRAIVRPYLDALVAEIDETAHLVTLRAKEMVFLDGVESAKPLRAADRTGTSLPAHTTAGGKALLAQLPDAALRSLYPEHHLLRRTPTSYKSRKALFDELHRIRERGYAQNNGESEPELAAYATAIRGRSGHTRVAVVISGPVARIVGAGQRQIIPALARVRSALAAALM